MGAYDKNGTQLTAVYDKNGNPLTLAYDKSGNEIFRGHAISQNFTKSLMYQLDMPTGTQGIGCDSITQTIAQFYGGHIYLIDLSDGTYTHLTDTVNLGHGGAGQFAPTKSNQQEYPTLYISSDNVYTVNDETYTYLFEFEITQTSCQCTRIFAVPVTISGSNHINIDFANGILYHTCASTYYGETDYTYIEAWDMTDLEVLDGASHNLRPSGGFYKLKTMLKRFAVPFVPESQSTMFFDGMICMLSDRSGAVNKYVQCVDVETETVYMTLYINVPGELEGIGFLLNESTDQYDMIVSARAETPATYYRFQFDLD